MKRCCVILLVLVITIALFSACANNETPEATPSETQTPEPTPRDFSGVDLTGVWSVSQVLDSLGVPVGEYRLKEIGADYTIELLDGGMYIICDAEGKEIGQGEYGVVQDRLTFSAGGGETVYAIQDENTIQCTADDGSVTVMTRCVDVSEDEEEEVITSPDEADIEAATPQSS
jgi:hypothetical protein